MSMISSRWLNLDLVPAMLVDNVVGPLVSRCTVLMGMKSPLLELRSNAWSSISVFLFFGSASGKTKEPSPLTVSVLPDSSLRVPGSLIALARPSMLVPCV